MTETTKNLQPNEQKSNAKPLTIHKKHKMTAADYVILACMIIFALLTLYPFWFVLIGSLNDGQDYILGRVFWLPRKFSLDSYRYVLLDSRLYTGFAVTVAKTVVGTACSLIFTAAVAYALSNPRLKFRNFFYKTSLFCMFFNGGLVPFFVWMVELGLYENFWVYILPALYSTYNMIIISRFFKDIPEELREAAIVDGAGEWRIMFTIYFRLSGPVFATVGLWLAVGQWNDYYTTMLYCPTSTHLHSLQYYLMKVIKLASAPPDTSNVPPEVLQSIASQTVSYAAIVIAAIPILCAFPYIQRHLKTGAVDGSLKG